MANGEIEVFDIDDTDWVEIFAGPGDFLAQLTRGGGCDIALADAKPTEGVGIGLELTSGGDRSLSFVGLPEGRSAWARSHDGEAEVRVGS